MHSMHACMHVYYQEYIVLLILWIKLRLRDHSIPPTHVNYCICAYTIQCMSCSCEKLLAIIVFCISFMHVTDHARLK